MLCWRVVCVESILHRHILTYCTLLGSNETENWRILAFKPESMPDLVTQAPNESLLGSLICVKNLSPFKYLNTDFIYSFRAYYFETIVHSTTQIRGFFMHALAYFSFIQCYLFVYHLDFPGIVAELDKVYWLDPNFVWLFICGRIDWTTFNTPLSQSRLPFYLS